MSMDGFHKDILSQTYVPLRHSFCHFLLNSTLMIRHLLFIFPRKSLISAFLFLRLWSVDYDPLLVLVRLVLHHSPQMEELLGAMEKVKQELESMKAKLSSTQQSLAEKEAHLTTLRAERRKHLEEVLEMK